jgi:hypothetical protein
MEMRENRQGEITREKSSMLILRGREGGIVVPLHSKESLEFWRN